MCPRIEQNRIVNSFLIFHAWRFLLPPGSSSHLDADCPEKKSSHVPFMLRAYSEECKTIIIVSIENQLPPIPRHPHPAYACTY